MDTPNVSLDELTIDNSEVVGLNGRPSGYCGYSPPIVRHIPSNSFCVLSYSRMPAVVWNREFVIREMAQLGRIKLLKHPLKLPLCSLNPQKQQPLVVWAKLSFLRMIDLENDKDFWSHLRWPSFAELPLRFIDTDHRIGLNCETEESVQRLFGEYATILRNRFDLLMQQVLLYPESLKQIAMMGLQAERDLEKRYWMYARVAMVSEKKVAEQIFRGAVQPIYKESTWDQFLNDMRSLNQQSETILTPSTVTSSESHQKIWTSFVIESEAGTLDSVS